MRTVMTTGERTTEFGFRSKQYFLVQTKPFIAIYRVRIVFECFSEKALHCFIFSKLNLLLCTGEKKKIEHTKPLTTQNENEIRSNMTRYSGGNY